MTQSVNRQCEEEVMIGRSDRVPDWQHTKKVLVVSSSYSHYCTIKSSGIDTHSYTYTNLVPQCTFGHAPNTLFVFGSANPNPFTGRKFVFVDLSGRDLEAHDDLRAQTRRVFP